MIVLDATVVVKLTTFEPGADRALARVAQEPERAAHDWTRIEVANALSRKVRRNGLSEAAARAARTGVDDIVTHEFSARELLDEGFELALRLHHAVYDCLYLALAVRERTMVLTHDAGFAAAAQRAAMSSFVELLA